jgi:hypothetical protein
MTPKNLAAAVALFAVSAAVPMLILTPRLARASLRTIAGPACVPGPGQPSGGPGSCDNVSANDYTCTWTCVAPNDSVQYPVGNLTGVYVDGYLYDAGVLNVFWQKTSYSGTYYEDHFGGSYKSGTTFDVYVFANNVTTNPSEYDYMWTQVEMYENPGYLSIFYGVSYAYSP